MAEKRREIKHKVVNKIIKDIFRCAGYDIFSIRMWEKKTLRAALTGKKIIIYGDDEYAEVLRKKFNVRIDYCIDSVSEGYCYGKPVRSIFDLSYERPGSFFVCVLKPDLTNQEIFNKMTQLGLVEGKDYAIIISHPVSYPEIRDVTLGFNRFYHEYDNRFPGFKIFGDIRKNSLRIVTLGGSTTNPLYNITSWSEYLYYLLNKNNIDVIIFNGGFNGYTSSDELIKLIRDGLSLLPDILISYSGTNDFSYETMDVSSIRYKKYFLSPHTEGLVNWIASQGGLPMLHGVRSDRNAVHNWIDNQRMMHNICEEFNIKHFGILQPNAYASGLPSAYIDARSKCEYGRSEVYMTYRTIKHKYDEAEKEIEEIPYILNFRHIFDGLIDYDIYSDYVHVYERGNEIIAANVFEGLKSMGIIK